MGQRFLDDFTEATRWVMFVRDIVVDSKWFFTQVCLAIDKVCYLNNTKPTAHSTQFSPAGSHNTCCRVSGCSSAEVSAFYIGKGFLSRQICSLRGTLGSLRSESERGSSMSITASPLHVTSLKPSYSKSIMIST
jgi:hypothetical protein